MLVFLLSKQLDPFYQIITSFPTVVFTFFLLLSLLFWCIAVLGLIDVNVLGIIDMDTGTVETNTGSSVNSIASVAFKLGLHGAPLTIVISLLSLIGWPISYFLVHYSQTVTALLPLGWLANLAIFIISLFIAIRLTAICLRPIRPLFKKMQIYTDTQLIGRTAIVRSSRVDNHVGEALVEADGAELIIKVRTEKQTVFKKSDAIVLLEYRPESNSYLVISPDEFI